jgi:hypothetical protein
MTGSWRSVLVMLAGCGGNNEDKVATGKVANDEMRVIMARRKPTRFCLWSPIKTTDATTQV